METLWPQKDDVSKYDASKIDFKYHYKLDRYKFDEVMGINRTQKYPVQLDLTVKQYKLPPVVATNDVQTNC